MAKFVLPPEQQQSILNAERTLHDLLPELDKSEECGVDCQAYRSAVKEMQGRIEAMKRNFFPQRGE